MGSGSQQYCLRWNNHRSNLLNVFEELLQNEAFTDVTLAMEGGASIKCHKMVLAACSSYFQNLFTDLPCKHPIVVLKDVRYTEIKAILEYMYRGEVNVAQDQLDALLRVAEVLKVKGLVEENGPQSKQGDDGRSSPLPTVGTSNGFAGMNFDDRRTVSPHSSGNASGSMYGAMYGEPSLDASQHRLSLPMWAFSGLAIPQHPSLDHRSSLLAGVNGYEGSSYKRKKYSSSHEADRDTPILRTVLGASQGQADCSQTAQPSMSRDAMDDSHAGRSNGPLSEHEMDRNETAVHGHLADVHLPDDADGRTEGSHSRDRTGPLAPGQKPNWKRYKQYTREDMMAAIEAVRTGMSTPKASRKFGVPSRTLYEKVNSLGITTSRPFKRSSNGGGGSSSSACFPYGIGGNVNGSIYSNRLSESESENSCATGENSAANAETAAVEAEAPAEDVPLQEESNTDEVEDLSVNRNSDQNRLTPTVAVKEETPDVSTDM